MTNKDISSQLDLHIPRLRTSRAQRLYYPINLRRCIKLLWGSLILNLLLLLAILFVFFSQPAETYYATSFAGKNTQIFPQSKTDAHNTTLAHQNDT